MFQEVLDLLQKQSRLFMAGDYEAMATLYVFPLLMILPFRPMVFQKPADLVDFYGKAMEDHRSRGLTGIRTTLAAVEIMREGRLRAWSRCHFDYPKGTDSLPYDVVYHLSKRPGQELVIEMADCQRPAVRAANLQETAAATA